MRIETLILPALFVAMVFAQISCTKSDLTSEQRRLQRIAIRAFRDAGETTHAGRVRSLLSLELESGCVLTTWQVAGSQTNTLTFTTTMPCILTSEMEEPNRHDPNGPLFGEVTIIPLTNLHSRITIWSGTNVTMPVVLDPSGQRITKYWIGF